MKDGGKQMLATYFHAGFLLGFDLEDGSNMFLRNIDWLSTFTLHYIPEDSSLRVITCQIRLLSISL
jgi:hypothetical protein